tara:strand:- start:8940 stop:10109 length:1170 start_codon:yes stop_codon:yes gene_type:complete
MNHILSNKNFNIALLGGGQLGKMFLAEARKLDICINVLDPSADAPAQLGANHFQQGDFKDFDTVFKFCSESNAVVIEIETVNVDALEALEKRGVPCFPPSRVLRIIQNKIRQKTFFKEKNISSSSFIIYKNLKSLRHSISNGSQSLPFVWKIGEGGYDGFGVKVIKNEKDTEDLLEGECIAESLVDIEKEIGVVLARDTKGEIRVFPPVEMEFHANANQVEFVICPSDISEEISNKCKDLAISVAESIEVQGLLAVELFISKKGEILVNELAPRPHNSGHLTIEACNVSQFDQLLRCTCKLPLGKIELLTNAAMANLVGEPGYHGSVEFIGLKDALQVHRTTLHLYGKSQTRPFRKMGHVTATGRNIIDARKRAKEFKSLLKIQSRDHK